MRLPSIEGARTTARPVTPGGAGSRTEAGTAFSRARPSRGQAAAGSSPSHGAFRPPRCSVRQARAGLPGRPTTIRSCAVATHIATGDRHAATPLLIPRPPSGARGRREHPVGARREGRGSGCRCHDRNERISLCSPRNFVEHTTNDMRAPCSGLSNIKWRAHRLSGPCCTPFRRCSRWRAL